MVQDPKMSAASIKSGIKYRLILFRSMVVYIHVHVLSSWRGVTTKVFLSHDQLDITHSFLKATFKIGCDMAHSITNRMIS